MDKRKKVLLIIILVCVLVGTGLFIFNHFKNKDKGITGNVIVDVEAEDIEIISGDQTDFCIELKSGRLLCKMGKVGIQAGNVEQKNVNISVKS